MRSIIVLALGFAVSVVFLVYSIVALFYVDSVVPFVTYSVSCLVWSFTAFFCLGGIAYEVYGIEEDDSYK